MAHGEVQQPVRIQVGDRHRERPGRRVSGDMHAKYADVVPWPR